MAIGNVAYQPPVKPLDVVDGDREPRDAGSSPQSNGQPSADSLGAVDRTTPMFPDYKTLVSRLQSFGDEYVKKFKGNPETLAKAGLFYNGFMECDRTVCFQCGGGLYQWDDGDSPIEEHARWYPDCAFVRLSLGDAEVQNIQIKHQEALQGAATDCDGQGANGNATDDEVEEAVARYLDGEATRRGFFEEFGITETTVRNAVKLLVSRGQKELIHDEREVDAAIKETVSMKKSRIDVQTAAKGQESTGSLCVLCQKNDRQVMFSPCFHLVACESCSKTLEICCVCKKPIADKIKAYLS
ncbi:unnamed protein product [Ixodes hexagonus]